MIGLDTNVIVRYLVQDDKVQAAKATEFIEKKLTVAKPGFISLIVLQELYWVLTSLYRVTRSEWLTVVEDLLASQTIHIEHRELVQYSIQSCLKNKAGFTDVLIAQIAKAAGCTETVSFDKTAVRLAGMAPI